MAEFKRIKVRATLESDVMLLTDDQIQRLVDEVCGRLRSTGLTLVSVEPEELVTTLAAVPVGYDN
mgnify:FL=1|jgi:hypothetical protein